MNEFVQLSLKTYDNLKETIDRLNSAYNLLCQEKTKLEDDLEQTQEELKDINSKLKNFALEKSYEDYYISYHADKCSNPNSIYFAIQNKDELAEMGISIEEQIEFIKRKLKEKENE